MPELISLAACFSNGSVVVNAIHAALRLKRLSALAEQPFGPEQALSCSLQAQSSLSLQDDLKSPPAKR